MENNCQNCNYVITDNFCGNCGQKKFKRIDRKYLIDEVQYSLIHTNKGFFYSVKNILRNPGKTAKEFIDGNRVNHYKPILLTFVLAGISAFLSLKVIGFQKVMADFYAKQNVSAHASNEIFAMISSYNSLIMLLFLPLVSILTYAIFRKWGNNFYEHIIMNAYIQCCYTLFCILVLYPVLFFLKGSTDGIFITITMLSMLSIPVIMVWFYKGFYPEKSVGKILLNVFLFVLVGFVIYIMLTILGVIIYIAINGLGSLKEFAPKK